MRSPVSGSLSWWSSNAPRSLLRGILGYSNIRGCKEKVSVGVVFNHSPSEGAAFLPPASWRVPSGVLYDTGVWFTIERNGSEQGQEYRSIGMEEQHGGTKRLQWAL